MRQSWTHAGRMAAATLVAGTSLVGVQGIAPAGAEDRCPLAALEKVSRPVAITMWHSMSQANEKTLQELTDQFNATQSAVKVTLVNQVSYDDTFAKYKSGLSSGDLPDVVQIQGSDQQQMVDTRTALPVGVCAQADGYSFSDFLPRVVSYFSVQGTVTAMPFSISGPVFLYNKSAFQRAGLDPDEPPTTLDDVRTAAQRLKQSGIVDGAPMALKMEPGFFQHWRAIANKRFVNNDNGRAARATRAVFDDPTGREIFAWISEMVKDGLAEPIPDTGTSQFDNLLGIGNGHHAMTIDTSASLGTITQFLATGQYPDVTLGVGPMPGPAGKGGVTVQGGALFIVNKSSAPKQAAAWQYLKFLDRPESQATWAVGTGYLPIVEQAAESQQVKDFWARNPGYRVAYDQLLTGVNSPATAGSVIGAYKQVSDVIRDAETSMYLDGKRPGAAVRAAASDATAAITEYNERVPAG
jgi:sn-glycerol 3-phosphate transport system substrate-binding protein